MADGEIALQLELVAVTRRERISADKPHFAPIAVGDYNVPG
jgi:hypothetical protein